MKIGRNVFGEDRKCKGFKEFPIKIEKLEKFINDALCEKLERDYPGYEIGEEERYLFLFIEKIKLNIERNKWLSCIIKGNINLSCKD